MPEAPTAKLATMTLIPTAQGTPPLNAEALVAELNEERDRKNMCRVCRDFSEEARRFIELALASGHPKSIIARKLEPYYGSCEAAVERHVKRHNLGG